jgi:hypothetical protein
MPKIDYRNADGKPLSGTTTIISQNLGWNNGALMGWAYNRGKAGLPMRDQEALDVGTLAHKIIEADIKKKKWPEIPPELKERVENCFLAYLEWKDSYKFGLIHSELSLVSETWQYGGTLDIVCEIKGILAILDIKTTKGGIPYVDQRIQIRAYAELFNENYPEKIQGYHVFNPDKSDGGFHHHYWPSLDREWEIFKHLLELEKLRKELK